MSSKRNHKFLAYATSLSVALAICSPMASAAVLGGEQQEPPAEQPIPATEAVPTTREFYQTHRNSMVMDFMRVHTDWQNIEAIQMEVPDIIGHETMVATINALRETLRNNVNFFAHLNWVISGQHNAEQLIARNLFNMEELRDFSETAHEIMSHIPGEEERQILPGIMIYNAHRPWENGPNFSGFYLSMSVLFQYLNHFSEYYTANY